MRGVGESQVRATEHRAAAGGGDSRRVLEPERLPLLQVDDSRNAGEGGRGGEEDYEGEGGDAPLSFIHLSLGCLLEGGRFRSPIG